MNNSPLLLWGVSANPALVPIVWCKLMYKIVKALSVPTSGTDTELTEKPIHARSTGLIVIYPPKIDRTNDLFIYQLDQF